MNIGSLYKVKMWSWLLFPTKETAIAVRSEHVTDNTTAAAITHGQVDVGVTAYTAYWGKQFNCEVTYFPLDSIVVFLEEDGELKRVLTTDGKIGWTWFNKIYNDYFEEVKAKS